MARASVHPRHKSKYQRIHRNDPRRSRCMILGAQCTAGQQKKIGRPKHAAASAHDAFKISVFKSRSAANAFRRKAPGRQSQQSQLLPHGRSQGCPSFPDAHGQLGSSSTTSPAPKPAPTPSAVAAAKDGFIPAMIWSTSGMEPVHQSSLTWNIAPMAGQESPPGNIPSTDAMVKLSKINLDLHIQLVATEMNRTILDLNSFIYREDPLSIQNYTLAEFMLKTSEDFLQILTRLCSSQKPVTQPLQSYQGTSHNPTPISSVTYLYTATQPLLAPPALTITSIFTQLISLYEVLLEHLTTRIERLSTESLTSISGVIFGGSPQEKPCTYGMLFSNIIVESLEEMESALGISEIDVLLSELDGRVGITPRDGATKPVHVKQLFRKAAVMLQQFSLGE
ncbi:hypothetical protein BDV23DRAFT_171872 [Aspergillus alliaceus]|uniref:Uncharacterized protein n=1 Tax=Petromyces alliaceus TaxID=209559 RepID=A0A5N7CAE2_PETAA|nr:hypothetical protein BDV23DRAFT_171872 [Aspergillus alliaceus]